MRRIGRSFTLVEILVVVAVIAILAGLLFPALSKAKGVARDIACVNTLRTISQAGSMYTQDYDSWIVPAKVNADPAKWCSNWGSWYMTLSGCTTSEWNCSSPYGVSFRMISTSDGGIFFPYAATSFMCPSEPAICCWEAGTVIRYLRNVHYGIGYVAGDANAGLGEATRKVERVRRPSECVFVGDSVYSNSSNLTHYGEEMMVAFRHGGGKDTKAAFTINSHNKREAGSVAYKTRGRGNISYIDGHVEAKAYQTLYGTPDEAGHTGNRSAFDRGF